MTTVHLHVSKMALIGSLLAFAGCTAPTGEPELDTGDTCTGKCDHEGQAPDWVFARAHRVDEHAGGVCEIEMYLPEAVGPVPAGRHGLIEDGASCPNAEHVQGAIEASLPTEDQATVAFDAAVLEQPVQGDFEGSYDTDSQFFDVTGARMFAAPRSQRPGSCPLGRYWYHLTQNRDFARSVPRTRTSEFQLTELERRQIAQLASEEAAPGLPEDEQTVEGLFAHVDDGEILKQTVVDLEEPGRPMFTVYRMYRAATLTGMVFEAGTTHRVATIGSGDFYDCDASSIAGTTNRGFETNRVFVTAHGVVKEDRHCEIAIEAPRASGALQAGTYRLVERGESCPIAEHVGRMLDDRDMDRDAIGMFLRAGVFDGGWHEPEGRHFGITSRRPLLTMRTGEPSSCGFGRTLSGLLRDRDTARTASDTRIGGDGHTYVQQSVMSLDDPDRRVFTIQRSVGAGAADGIVFDERTGETAAYLEDGQFTHCAR